MVRKEREEMEIKGEESLSGDHRQGTRRPTRLSAWGIPVTSPRPRRGQRRASWWLALPLGTALLGWLRVPSPLASGRASPGGGGRAIIAQRRSAHPGKLCKDRGSEGPGRPLSRLSGQACAGARDGRGSRGASRCSRWRLCLTPRESTAAIVTGNKEGLGSQPGPATGHSV